MEKNYWEFFWENEMVGTELVSKIKVQIHKPIPSVIADGYFQLVTTDGTCFKKSTFSFKTRISNYSYVLLSSGIFQRSSGKCILFLKLYITDTFQPSQLEKEDFLGKSYVLQVLESSTDFDLTPPPTPQPLPFREYLKKKDLLSVYDMIRLFAEKENFEQVEELFRTYNIPMKYQAIFWKEMYAEIAKNQK